jgi:hypothetical protein
MASLEAVESCSARSGAQVQIVEVWRSHNDDHVEGVQTSYDHRGGGDGRRL